jgi:hypothetical protein
MSIIAGPKIINEGLIFSIDAANRKFISPLGNNSFNGAQELISNIVSNSSVNSFNGVSMGNLNFFTAIAIDFNEANFGGDAASRHGITPGLNVRSGTKLYGASRALHMWVWNNDTSSWLPTSFFNGRNLSGHCYDSWTGYSEWQTEVGKFVTDYNNIKAQFKNCTFILMGSHRDSGHTTDKINILLELGAPSNVSSLLGGAPEWILVGEPTLGPGNSFGWAYENYTTDPTRVAHLNFGLPIYGNKDNYLSFDGVDDYINCGTLATGGKITVNAWINISSSRFQHIVDSSSNSWHLAILDNNRPYFWNGSTYHQSAQPLSNNTWYMITGVQGSTLDIYINGVLSQSIASNVNISTNNVNIGRYQSGSRQYNGKISNVSIYDRALTASEIKQNFEATRSRYGI